MGAFSYESLLGNKEAAISQDRLSNPLRSKNIVRTLSESLLQKAIKESFRNTTQETHWNRSLDSSPVHAWLIYLIALTNAVSNSCAKEKGIHFSGWRCTDIIGLSTMKAWRHVEGMPRVYGSWRSFKFLLCYSVGASHCKVSSPKGQHHRKQLRNCHIAASPLPSRPKRFASISRTGSVCQPSETLIGKS